VSTTPTSTTPTVTGKPVARAITVTVTTSLVVLIIVTMYLLFLGQKHQHGLRRFDNVAVRSFLCESMCSAGRDFLGRRQATPFNFQSQLFYRFSSKAKIMVLK